MRDNLNGRLSMHEMDLDRNRPSVMFQALANAVGTRVATDHIIRM